MRILSDRAQILCVNALIPEFEFLNFFIVTSNFKNTIYPRRFLSVRKQKSSNILSQRKNFMFNSVWNKILININRTLSHAKFSRAEGD